MGASIVIGVIVVVFIGLIGVNIQLSLWLRGFRRGAPAEGRDGDQVRRIMADRRVREVFFVGHGGPGGISLIERVVPVENRHRCFYFGREIKSRDVEAGFERLAGFIDGETPKIYNVRGGVSPSANRMKIVKYISGCILPLLISAAVSADSDVEAYREAYRRALSSQADAYIIEGRAELSRLSDGVQKAPPEERISSICVLKDLLPEKMSERLKGLEGDGVLLAYGYTEGVCFSRCRSLSPAELEQVFGKKVLDYPDAQLGLHECNINKDLTGEVRRKLGKGKGEGYLYAPRENRDFRAALKEFSGEWCGYNDGSGGRSPGAQLRVMFSGEEGPLVGKATWTWPRTSGGPLGEKGYVSRMALFPEDVFDKNGGTVVAFRALNQNHDEIWRAAMKPEGLYLRGDDGFNLTRDCENFWKEYSPVSFPVNSDFSDTFTFEPANGSSPVLTHSPVTVKVSLKRDFKGVARFFSCDTRRFKFLDMSAGEFVAGYTYEINSRAGDLARLTGEFSGNGAPPAPFICGEAVPNDEPWERRYYARRINTEPLRLAPEDDWYDSHIMDALALDNTFARNRTDKLLTGSYPREKTESLLPGLVSWIIEDTHAAAAERAIKVIIGKYGGEAAAQALIPALASPFPEVKKSALRLLGHCGEYKAAAFDAINEMLREEKDEGVRREAVSLAREWGFDIPPRSLKIDEISAEAAAAYKAKIRQVCDRAAKVDLTWKEEYPRYYDDKGVRIPTPPEAAAAIRELEDLLDTMPGYPELARAYLLLGRLMQRFESYYNWSEDSNDRLPVELRDKREQYQDGEPDSAYYYNGYHFNRLIELFPDGEYADDAAFEKTAVMSGGTCEGDENCAINWGMSAYLEFLNNYPASSLAAKAIAAINESLEWVLSRPGERLAESRDFSLKEFKKTIGNYQQAVKALAPAEKAKAYDVICALWAKSGENGKAIEACEDLMEVYPGYPLAADIRARLDRMRLVGFELAPPVVAGYRLAELRWEAVEGAAKYSIYRSTEGSENFESLGSVSGEPVFQDKTIVPATNYVYYVEADTGSGQKPLSNRVIAHVPGKKHGANFVFYNADERALNILGYVYNSQHEGLPVMTRVLEDGKVESRVAGAFYGYFKSDLDKYADGVMLVDPVHGRYLKFPDEQAFEKNIQVVRKQDTKINPYLQGKWWPRAGKYSISIRKDGRGVWLAGRQGDSWPQHDFLAWDADNNVCWEARGRALIRYDSTESDRGTPVYPGENIYYMGIYPDERDGSVWAVGTQGYFYKVSSSGAVTTQFRMGRVNMINNVAFSFENNYAWIMNVSNEDPQRTTLKRISLADGAVLAEIKPDEYTIPGEKHGNFSLFISLDHKTGNLWVFNGGSWRVTKLSPEGIRIMSMAVSEG